MSLGKLNKFISIINIPFLQMSCHGNIKDSNINKIKPWIPELINSLTDSIISDNENFKQEFLEWESG